MRNRSIPFGYYYQNGVLVVHPQESQTVRAVFAAYLSGEPLSKIAAHLTAKLVEYLPGRWQWDKARVKRILDNAKYTGAGDFPPIIKERDFQMAHQKKESANTNRQSVDKDVKLFKSLVHCHHCGAPMVRRMDSFFLCPTRTSNSGCFSSRKNWWKSPCWQKRKKKPFPWPPWRPGGSPTRSSAGWTAAISPRTSWLPLLCNVRRKTITGNKQRPTHYR